MGDMTRLTYLNLSDARLGGSIPDHLGNLSRLECLDLSGSLFVDDFSWVSGLSSLQHLDMGGVDLTRAAPNSMQQVLSQLPSLSYLGLSRCGLNYTHLFSSTTHPSINSTFLPPSLHYLDLSWNTFYGPIPTCLQNITSLRALDLSFNLLTSSVPLWLGNLKNLVSLILAFNYELDSVQGGMWLILKDLCHLQSLDLSENHFHGEQLASRQGNKSASKCITYDLETVNLADMQLSGYLPDWVGKFSNLKHFDASKNWLHGPIPSSLGRLSFMRELDLSNNHLNGSVPTSLGRLSALTKLDLSDNQLVGSIPTSLGRLSSLTLLDLSNNGLNGTVPDSVGKLANLYHLNISSNSLEGVVSTSHFANLSSLKLLSIGSNHLVIKVESNWIPPFQLGYLEMRSCKFEPREFPKWVQTQKQVKTLALSDTGTSATLPIWLLQDMPNIVKLDLSHNQIRGAIPNVAFSANARFTEINLADNLLDGPIPSSFCNLDRLWILDISENKLSGHLPDCWKDSQELVYMKLSSNKLSGLIPSSFTNLSQLGWLLLSNNNLSGDIPLGLSKCKNLATFDLADNCLSGNIPNRILRSLSSLQIFNLRNNMFNGTIPTQLCLLSQLRILDLAENDLQGRLPTCFANLTGMMVSEQPSAATATSEVTVGSFFYTYDQWDKANVRQVIKGRELEYTTVLKFVVNIDLSGNRLVGPIPRELIYLSGLIGLNLSHNLLWGSIPKGIGEMRSLQSLDLSRNQLVGTIPETLSALTQLSYLNLSHNKLVGKIPKGNQLQTLDDASIYEGNPQLCGAPLPQACPGDDPTSTGFGGGRTNEEESDDERVWSYVVMMGGYAIGFWAVIGVLLIKKHWRLSYFRTVEDVGDKIYVAVAILKSKAMNINGRRENESI